MDFELEVEALEMDFELEIQKNSMQELYRNQAY